jgi:hypothetical protein
MRTFKQTIVVGLLALCGAAEVHATGLTRKTSATALGAARDEGMRRLMADKRTVDTLGTGVIKRAIAHRLGSDEAGNQRIAITTLDKLGSAPQRTTVVTVKQVGAKAFKAFEGQTVTDVAPQE